MIKIIHYLLHFAVLTFTPASCYLNSRGTHFVATCPWAVVGRTVCDVYIITDMKIVEVGISEENEILPSFISEKKHYAVERDKPYTFRISVNKGYTHRRPTNSYPVWTIRSTGPVKVIINTHTKNYESVDTLNLSPRDKCFASYYTVTANGYPFFTIVSFDEESIIQVKFPQMRSKQRYFNLDCFANVKCAPRATVTTRLGRYQAWYFAIDDRYSNLNDVFIKADQPVNVISGNSYIAWSENQKSVADLCTTSVKPVETWGKTYIVPNSGKDMRAFTFRTVNNPILIKIHEDFASNTVIKEYSISSSDAEPFLYKTDRTIAVTSDVPFGVYQLFSAGTSTKTYNRGGISILNLIPVEQWTHSISYIDPPTEYDQSLFNVNYYLITQAKKAYVKFSNIVPREVHLKWQMPGVTVNGKTYFVAKMNLIKRKTRIYVYQGASYFVLYIIANSRTDKTVSTFSYPYEYNQGQIYQQSCTMTEITDSNDGIDNDCDGFIDEEIKNGVDDDGDGEIDEDNVGFFLHGQWSKWTYLCDEWCMNKTISVRVRSCSNGSAFEKLCEGKSIQCDEKECPADCGKVGRSDSDCVCNLNCLTCRNSMFECDKCQSGYMHTDTCLAPCPEGWVGVGCLERKFDLEMVKGGDSAPKEETFSIWSIVLSAIVILMVIAFFVGNTVFLLQLNDEPENEKKDAIAKKPKEKNEDEDLDIENKDLSGQVSDKG